MADIKPEINEIATIEADVDIWNVFGKWLGNPDPVIALKGSGKGVKLYDEVWRDAHSRSVLETRAMAVSGAEWELDPADDSAKAAEIAAQVKEILNSSGLSKAVKSLMKSVLYGFWVVEILWKTESGYTVPRFISKHPRRFAFSPDRTLRLLTKTASFDGVEIPERKFVVCTWGDDDNPYGEGLGQVLWWNVWFKKVGIKFWLKALERFGQPTTVGKYPPGTPVADQDKLQEAMEAMQASTGIKIPDTMKIELLEATKAGAVEYGPLVDVMNRDASKVVLGQTGTTEMKGEGGLGSSNKVHDEVRLDIAKGDGDELAEHLTKTLVRWIVDFNWGTDAPAPKLWFRIEEESDLKPLAERDSILVKDIGLPVANDYFYDTYAIPRPEAGQVLVAPASVVANGGQPAVPAAFADVSTPEIPGIAEAESGQALVDGIAERAAQRGVSVFGLWIDEVSSWMNAAKSLEAAKSELCGALYGALSPNDFTGLLAKAMQAADDAGAASVGDEPAQFAEWGPGTPFTEAADFFKARAFTIAGVSKADLLSAVRDEISKAIDTGSTLAEFKKAMPDIFARHGYKALNPHRVKTIFQTNIQSAFQAGRYRQMTDPAVRAARPFWRYSAVMDLSTRQSHAAMNGFIARWDDPVWQSWYPPNGFNCRCTVTSLSQGEMERDGFAPDPEPPALWPDEGWGERADLESVFKGKREGGEKGRVNWKETPGQPGPETLGRPKESGIPAVFWLPTPPRLPSLEEMTARGMTETQALKEVETAFRTIMGIAPNETFAVLMGPDGETVNVDMSGMAHAMLKREQARERFIPFMRQVIENPYEILLTEYSAETGQTKFRKKYIGIFEDEKKESIVITAELGPDGAVIWNVMPVRKGTLDRQRRAQKVLFGQGG